MGYREAIKQGERYNDSELKDICVSIVTETHDYDLAFIEFETADLLGIRVTRKDFSEGFVVLNKKYIISVSMIYEGDIVITPMEEHDDPSYI